MTSTPSRPGSPRSARSSPLPTPRGASLGRRTGNWARPGTQDGSVLRALAPVAEKLTAVQQQVSLLERDRLEQYGQLAQELQEARLSDEQLLRSTHALESALRSNSARGQWGEVQRSCGAWSRQPGMLRHVDFHEQLPGRRRRQQPPARPSWCSCPGDKQLVVDAKVPLASYLAAQELGGVPGAGLQLGAGRPAASRRTWRRMPRL